jgi:hypothetical protein
VDRRHRARPVAPTAAVEHLQAFRNARDDLDVVSLHYYEDLKADLEGQMRELAAHLEIEVDEDRWPRLVRAATFESMRSRAESTVGAGREHWIDPAAFFNRGTSGQWRDLLDDADLARYAARVRALESEDLVEWWHRQPID